MDQVMVRCAMKGKKPKSFYAGYSEHLTIQSKLPSRTTLMAYSPTQLATSTSYDVGVEASSNKTVGISASTTITKKALEINSYSDVSARLFKLLLNQSLRDGITHLVTGQVPMVFILL